MDKNTLNKLLKEKKLTETLMKDESFKKEAKKILNEESVNITDTDIMSILKVTEKVLSGETNITSEEDLDEVVGGLGSVDKLITREIVIRVCNAAGIFAGNALGAGVGLLGAYYATQSNNDPEIGPWWNTNAQAFVEKHPFACASAILPSAIGTYAGSLGGTKLGKLICDKLGLDD